MAHNYKRIIVKVGSNVLTGKDGLPDLFRIGHIAGQVADIRAQGREVILVSSGAVASGKSVINVSEKQDAVAARQLLASIGQVRLMNTYAGFFEKHGVLCSQVLVTREDFRDRLHYLNMKNCLEILLRHTVIPVINENDVVSVTELMFTDNDELAGLVASMLNAQALIVLTNVDGIYDGDPAAKTSKLITEVNSSSPALSSFVSPGRSQFGRGGMITKAAMAKKVAQLGIGVHIANGTRDNVLLDVLNDTVPHTFFAPDKKASGKKKWIAHSANFATGVVRVNDGAKAALLSDKASSLLPVGIVDIVSAFKKGEVIKLLDAQDKLIGIGVAEYGSEPAREMIGLKNQKPLVHYDYLYLQC